MLKKRNKKPSSGVIFICKDVKQQKIILIAEQAFVFLKEYPPSVLNINTIAFGEQKSRSIQRQSCLLLFNLIH